MGTMGLPCRHRRRLGHCHLAPHPGQPVSSETPRRRFRPFTPMTRGAAHATVFLFALSFLLAGSSYWLATRAVNGEIANRATVTQLCLSGNDFRAQQVTLWT